MIKAFTLSILTLGLVTGLRAQTSDIIVFSEAGEKFTLVIDGAVQNEVPAARVEARGIRNDTPLLVVNFADPSIPSVRQNGWVEPGQEYTMAITMNRKGVRVLRLRGQVPQHAAAPSAPVEKPAPSNFQEDTPAVQQEIIATDVPSNVTRTTTTTTVTEGDAEGGVSMSIDMGGMGVNVSVKDGTDGTTTTTTTTTTTVTTTTREQQVIRNEPRMHGHNMRERNNPVADTPATPVADGCGTPMFATDFASAKASIESKGFEDTKLTLAKQIAGSNCLSTEQVKTVMGLFGFEDTRLDFAKFAYDHVSDRKNYYKVNDAFGFSSSVDELNEYIQSR